MTTDDQGPDDQGPLHATLAQLHPRGLLRLADDVQGLLTSRLWLQIIVGLALGVGVGILLGPEVALVSRPTAAVIGEWVALPGHLFLGAIQMIVVPLVFASVIRGIASNESADQLRKTGSRLVVYFLGTTSVAVVLGCTVGLLLRPGARVDAAVKETMRSAANLAPDVGGGAAEALSLGAIPSNIVSLLPANSLSALANAEMLQVVILALVFGLALVSMPPKTSRPMLEFLGSLEEVCMTVVRWVMVLAPVAVFGLIAKVTLSTGWAILGSLGFYVATVLLGLGCLLVFYIGIVAIVARRQPFTFLAQIKDAMLMAFSTNSSAATMPVSLRVAEENVGIRPSTARFIIPIGATVNMDASALYQALATLFVAQLYGIELSLPSLVVLLLTVVGASIGTPATPGVGIAILSSVLQSVGIPLEGLALIIGVDRVLELFRASLNVTGDLVCCAVMDRWVPAELSADEEREREAARELERERTGVDTLVAADMA